MFWKALFTLPLVFAALPATTNYQLNSYGFGSGGTAGSSTANYSLEGISGEAGGQTASTSTYNEKPGFVETQQAHVPKISSFTNGSGRFYNKLHFVIDQQSNPTDALYALQISTTSDFSSGNNYVKADLTIGPVLALTDYQIYAAWGGSSGSDIIGLNPSTTYYLRAKATQGRYTESGWGPSLSASTVNPSISFSVSPTTLPLGNLYPATIVSSSISLSFDTNAASGGDIYTSGQNGGLHSSIASNTIPAVSGDLNSLSRGFGLQVSSVSQTSGGPLAAVSPYDGYPTSVGIVNSTIRKIVSSASQVNNGSATISVQSKAAANDTVANDYQEILTILASASF